jgi:hypothetical protein
METAVRSLASSEHEAKVRQPEAQSPTRRNRCGDGALNGWFYAAGVLRPAAIVTTGRKERIGLSHRGTQSRRFSSLT